MAERYQDYVIKDGKFIGKFEEMYQKFEDPWQQSETGANSYVRHSTLFTLRSLNSKRVLEIGCGLGYFTKYMYDNCPEIRITGIDISETAVSKARKAFPGLDFQVCDISEQMPCGGGI